MTPKIHEPGVYFVMPADEYHTDPALGSSDIRALIKSPRKYWLRSPLNPHRVRYEDGDTKATMVGSALHDRLLLGEDIFNKHYLRRPDDRPGASSGDKSTLTKTAKAALKPGQELLHADDWTLVEDTARIITRHPDLREVFRDAHYEVSIFWVREDGIRCKARLDILKPRGIGDLKTLANEQDLRLETACKHHIRRYAYHIQAEHYLEARRQIPALIDDGRCSLKHVSFLEECASQQQFAFQLIFVSKALPEVWACVLSPGNPMLTYARDQIETAMTNYLAVSKVAGPGEWLETWRLGELTFDDMPGGEHGWS